MRRNPNPRPPFVFAFVLAVVCWLVASIAHGAEATATASPQQLDYGHAVFNQGNTTTVWVDHFAHDGANRVIAVNARGRFQPDVPFGNARRYSQDLNGTANLANAGGKWSASGVFVAGSVDGDYTVDLLRNGIKQEQLERDIPDNCAADAPCAYALTFDQPFAPDGALWTARVFRRVAGGQVGERLIDMSVEPCASAVRARFGLAPGYDLRGDVFDNNYVTTPSGRNLNDAVIAPLCREPATPPAAPTPTPAPAPTPAPTPAPPPAPTPAPTAAAPPPPACPTCPPAEAHVLERMPADVAASLRAGTRALGKRWADSVKRAQAWLDSHRVIYVPSPRSTGETGQKFEAP